MQCLFHFHLIHHNSNITKGIWYCLFIHVAYAFYNTDFYQQALFEVLLLIHIVTEMSEKTTEEIIKYFMQGKFWSKYKLTEHHHIQIDSLVYFEWQNGSHLKLVVLSMTMYFASDILWDGPSKRQWARNLHSLFKISLDRNHGPVVLLLLTCFITMCCPCHLPRLNTLIPSVFHSSTRAYSFKKQFPSEFLRTHQFC